MIELLADNNFGDTRTGSLAGPTGLVIILLLIIGTVLLIRNMNSRLRRLPERFDGQSGFGAAPGSPGVASSEAAAVNQPDASAERPDSS